MAQKGGPRYRGQQLLDNAPCQAVVNLGSGALLFPINRALLVQHRPDRPAKGSPIRGAVERSETERFLRNIALTQRPPFGDSSSVRGFSFALVRTMESIILSFLLLLYAILRKSQALHRKFTVTLLLAFPVSFWRNVWYNGFAALPAHLFGRGGETNA